MEHSTPSGSTAQNHAGVPRHSDIGNEIGSAGGDPRRAMVTFRCPAGLLDRLKGLAAERGVSLTDLLLCLAEAAGRNPPPAEAIRSARARLGG